MLMRKLTKTKTNPKTKAKITTKTNIKTKTNLPSPEGEHLPPTSSLVSISQLALLQPQPGFRVVTVFRFLKPS